MVETALVAAGLFAGGMAVVVVDSIHMSWWERKLEQLEPEPDPVEFVDTSGAALAATVHADADGGEAAELYWPSIRPKRGRERHPAAA